MKRHIIDFWQKITAVYHKHKKLIFGLVAIAIIAIVALVSACHLIISHDKRYILPTDTKTHTRVGLVLGAGITKSGKPFKELQARLDVAAAALNDGQVDKLILSGDNRVKNYNEPDAMKAYLVNVKHISPSKLQPDYAGRSTYESCERANKIFGLHETIIYSAPSHLPRAIYLCRHLHVTAYGVSSGVDGNNGFRRELLADVKAVFNVYIIGPRTVLGRPIPI
jgi:vancomycin permeability regulator SanA